LSDEQNEWAKKNYKDEFWRRSFCRDEAEQALHDAWIIVQMKKAGLPWQGEAWEYNKDVVLHWRQYCDKPITCKVTAD